MYIGHWATAERGFVIFQNMTSCLRLKPRLLNASILLRWSSSRSTNPYAVLGLSPDATPTEVRESFFRLAKQLHPDTNPEDPEAKRKFEQVREAYQILKDKKSRITFDNSRDTDTERPSRKRVNDYEIYMESKERFYPNKPWSERQVHRFRSTDQTKEHRPYNYRTDFQFRRQDPESFTYRHFAGPAPEPKELKSAIKRLMAITGMLVLALIFTDNDFRSSRYDK